MKYLYITGLEHSGTTLLSHLLGLADGALALGEVARFFSPEGMRVYLQRWGAYPDHRLCSCGATWETCPFWGELVPLCGLNSSAPLAGKYQALMQHARDKYPQVALMIDSTKAVDALRVLVERGTDCGLAPGELQVAIAIRDLRGFIAAIRRKSGSKPGLLAALRTCNWWLGRNRGLLDYLQARGMPNDVVFYEQLCADPEPALKRVLTRAGLSPPALTATAHNRSHIVLGNKDFLGRNRGQLRYDTRWMLDDISSVAYLLHAPAQRFNRRVWRESR